MGRYDDDDMEGFAPPKKRLHTTLDDKRRKKELRLNIIAKLYRHGYSYREIRNEVKARLDLERYSLQTVHSDIQTLLEEWRKERHFNEELNIGDSLVRIEELIREAWDAWEESKKNYTDTVATQRGIPAEQGQIKTLEMAQRQREVHQQGDPRYLEIIFRLNQERNKILGVYAPEKQIVTADVKNRTVTPEEARQIIDGLEDKY